MGYTYRATYYGIDADSVEVTDATSAVATWTRGVPVTPPESAGVLRPDLIFIADTTTLEFKAFNRLLDQA